MNVTQNGRKGTTIKSSPEALARMLHQLLRNQETAIQNYIDAIEMDDKSHKRTSERLAETRKLLIQVLT